ncbi:MAG: translocation/assembly module TamB domain-containing protein, partial [Myxococcota bacterium]
TLAVAGQGLIAVPIADAWQTLRRGALSSFTTAPVDAQFTVDDFALNRLISAGVIEPPWTQTMSMSRLGQVSGRFDVSGTISDPLVALRDGTLSGAHIRGRALPQTTFSGQLSMRDLRAELAMTQRDGGGLQVRADYRFGEPDGLDAMVTATGIDMSLLRALASSSTDIYAGIGGRVDGQVRVRGELERPLVVGTVELRDGTMWLADGSWRIHEAATELVLNQDLISIRQLSARVNQGKVTGSGTIELDNNVPRRLVSQLKADELDLVWPSYTAFISGDSKLTGTFRDGTLELNLSANRNTTVALRETGRSLHSLEQLTDVEYVNVRESVSTSDEAGGPVQMIRVRITAPDGLRVTAEEGDARIRPSPALVLELPEQAPLTLTGSIDVMSGEAFLFDQTYRIEYGQMKFDSQSFDPGINARLIGEFSIATVFIDVSGSLLDPQISLSANPAASETAVLTIMLGLDPDDTEEVVALGTISTGADLFDPVRKRLPVRVDVVRVHSDGISFGRWLSRNILLSYRYRNNEGGEVTGQNTNEAAIRWRVRRNLLLEGQYGDADIGGLDLLWRHRF